MTSLDKTTGAAGYTPQVQAAPKPLNRKAVVPLSGGLDSILAIKILQEQGIEVEAFNVRTQFECCKLEASKMAHELGVRITVADTGADYLDLVRRPKNGWGKGINPCVDCRAYMFRLAARHMEQVGATWMATGEVAGQRPNSQLLHQIKKVEIEAGLPGILLRPLSAHLLPPTRMEQEGIIDRSKLFGFSGRSRKPLIALAKQRYGLTDTPSASAGCRLTEVGFAKRTKDAWAHGEANRDRWEYELLKIGRHARLPSGEKVVVGRNESENRGLAMLHKHLSGAVLFEPENFVGPSALSVSGDTEAARAFAGGALCRYSRDVPAQALIRYTADDGDVGTFTAGGAWADEQLRVLMV